MNSISRILLLSSLLTIPIVGCRPTESPTSEFRTDGNIWVSWILYDKAPTYAVVVNRPIHLAQRGGGSASSGRFYELYNIEGGGEVRVESNAASGPITIDGRSYDLKNGKTFLIDLLNGGRVTQVDVELPLPPLPPNSTEIDFKFESAHPTVREFIVVAKQD